MNLAGAVNGVTLVEEHRVRQRRTIVAAGEPAPLETLWPEDAVRCAEAPSPGGDRPLVARHAVDRDVHGLCGLLDLDEDRRLRRSDGGQQSGEDSGNHKIRTHTSDDASHRPLPGDVRGPNHGRPGSAM